MVQKLGIGSVLALLLVVGRSGAAEPSYAKDVQPFLAKYCMECHSGAKPKAGLRLTNYAELFQDHKKGRPVVAGNPNQSSLIRTLEGRAKQMPPKNYKAQPTADEVAVVKAWIKAGAKDDSATRGALDTSFPQSGAAAAIPHELRPAARLALPLDGENCLFD
jgi:hypothetical protein